jgi:hypothetical protein
MSRLPLIDERQSGHSGTSHLGLGRFKTLSARGLNTERRGDLNCFFCELGYALIAAIGGWIPMMFITLVRL